jgi:hypothetical protein
MALVATLACSVKGAGTVTKQLISDDELHWYIRATHLATPAQIIDVFHCNATTPTETCFLPPKERDEMLVNGRVTVSNRGLDFLNVCRKQEPLLQAAYKREPQFTAILSGVAVGLTGSTERASCNTTLHACDNNARGKSSVLALRASRPCVAPLPEVAIA